MEEKSDVSGDKVSDGKAWYERKLDGWPEEMKWYKLDTGRYTTMSSLFHPSSFARPDEEFIALNDDECIIVVVSTWHYKRMRVEDVE